LQTGELVAIKALRPEVVSSDPNALARFLREGEALRQLNHPNIVRVVDGLEQDGRHYLVMEYVPGGSLRDLVDQRPGTGMPGLSIERTVEIALDVADALTRAHRLDILHRDLKPSNVLLAEDGTPCLTDFSLAYLATAPRLTQTGTILGTVLYLSPEACRGESLDARADIWSFGVMLYEMLTGLPPFSGDTFPEVLMAILSQPVPDLSEVRPEVPDALADLVYRMLEKDRGLRIPSVRLVGAELEATWAGYRRRVDGRQVDSREWHPITDSRFAEPTPPAEAEPNTCRVLHNLPAQTTHFVGRESELESLARLLADPDIRLITVLGPGGIGKTRLALKLAEQRIADQPGSFADGVYLVSLAPIRAGRDMVSSIAGVIGYRFYPGREPKQQLLDYLREKQMLLVMDNCEHLLAGREADRGDGVGLVTEILQAAPGVQVLATSREKLALSGETAFVIEGMTYPDGERTQDALECSAVRLFMQSARRVRPTFEFLADDLRHVTQICYLVQGMPLAILLAAAWVDVLSLAEIVREIEGQMPVLGLDFLETDMRDFPERHRSMRAVFESSWSRLTEAERCTFAMLSVFRGGFAREAAQAVTGVGVRTLMALTNKSLLHRQPTGRYEVHEWLRQYAGGKLDEAPAVKERILDLHCEYYAEFCHRRESDFSGGEPREALLEIDNIRTGWRRAVERSRAAEIQKLSDSLWFVYSQQGWYQEANALWAESADVLRAGEVVGENGIALGSVLGKLGLLCAAGGDREQGAQLVEEGLSILCKLRARRELASCMIDAVIVHVRDEYPRAKQLLRESLAIYRELGDRQGRVRALCTLGLIAMDHQVDYCEAEQCCREAVRLARALRDRQHIAWALSILGRIARAQGEYADARKSLGESLAYAREINAPAQMTLALLGLGDTAFALGEHREAQKCYQQALATRRAMNRPDLTARSLGGLGNVALVTGDYQEARRLCRQALQVVVDRQALEWVSLEVLVGSATLLTRSECGGQEGNKERALEVVALVLHHPACRKETAVRAQGLILELYTQLPPEIPRAAEERGRAGDLWGTAEALLAELEKQ
jgi:predicted ATPase